MSNDIFRWRAAAAVICCGPHLRRTGTIAAVVGTWLTLVNQGDVISAWRWSPALAGKIVLNYATPFVVSNLGLLSRRFRIEDSANGRS
ncbi:MAG TPA: hypothetical protein VK457_07515 [Chloroflexota bacterium]|nr:hypothetical protein [Chloroflexota bacterium]